MFTLVKKKLTGIRHKLFFSFLLILVLNKITAQVILKESFEGNFPPAGWTLINASTAGGNNWTQDIFQALSGTYSMACYNGNGAPNAWAFTPQLALTGGNVYRISYWYKVTNGASGLKVTVGNGATIASQNTVLHTYASVTSTVYAEGVDYFDAPATGNYNFAFNCNSAGGYYAYGLELDSIVIKQMPKCSGTPVPGVAATSTPVICGGDSATISLTGNNNLYGLSFQWQSSAVGANSFSDIPNATDTFIRVSPLTSTDYRCVVSCSVSGLNSNSNIVTLNIDPACYCHLPAVDCQYVYISNVTFGGINNSSSCSPPGFTYYSAVAPASIYPATSIPITVTVNSGANKYVGVWVDFNKNGRFDSTEYTNLGYTSGSIAGSIAVPANAVLGTTRMRVRERVYYPFAKTDACASAVDMYETEEYNVNILTLAPCTVTPTGGTTTSSVPSICPLTDFTLSVTGSGISGIIASYQWQSSPDNTTWTDIAGATGATLTTRQSVATWYRRKIICNNSLFAYSAGYLQALSPFANCYCTPGASSCGGITITSVQFGSINNTSGCGSYANYTGTVPAAAINAGTFVPLTVSFTANAVFTGTAYVKAWLDFNQNGIFENEESFNAATSGSNSTSTFLVRIPFDAKAGVTRMRVKIETGGFDQIDPCTVRSSGEAEDYAVNITASATPSKFFVVYVNKIATGANNGASWTNALTGLGTAYAIVKNGDTIKVAKGTYTPGYIITSGVTYLGGYPDTGNPTDADRNFAVNQTVLTGQEMAGFNLNSSTVLNGFILDNLAAIGGFNAAIRMENAAPVITNCVFTKNTLRVLYMYNSSPRISNCFFLNNTDDYLNKGQIQLVNNSNPVISNCVFNNNTSTSMINASGSTLNLVNATFANNRILKFNNGTINTQAEVIGTAGSTINIANSIFSDYWNGSIYFEYSKLSDSSNVFTDNSSAAAVTNSITAYNQAGTGLLKTADPKFKDSSNAAGADNLLFTADDGLQLINPCSPAMNAGLNILVPATTDILGNPRMVSTAVDMGAYEVQGNPAAVPGTLYVNAQATGSNNGSSWANAFTSLQTALSYCSDTVKVAAGTYYPSANDKIASFQLQSHRVILGGYPNSGNPGNNQRDPVANPTVLSGILPGPGNVKSDNVVQGILVDSTAMINGFIIQDGQKAGIYLSYNGNPVVTACRLSSNAPGAVILKQSRPRFVRCTFSNNSGGINCNNANPVIDSCAFNRNTDYSAVSNYNRSLPVIKNSSFLGNSNSASGGDIYNDNSDPVISNCSSDSAYAYFGGSIANVNNSNPVITKCIFSNGQTPYYVSVTGGAVCYNNNSKPYFLNCSFIGSKGAGGAFYNTNSTVKLENCLGYGNTPAYFSPYLSSTSFMQNWSSTADIINTTIIKNGGGSEVFGNANNSVLNIKNSILWNNNFNYTGDSYYNIIINNYNPEVNNATGSVTNISNSITRIYGTNGTGGNMVGVDPRFIDINKPAGADGIFGTADDGLQLCSCSPAINTAVNAANGTTADISGNPRVANTTIDMGAFEYQPSLVTTSKTTYVSAAATGSQDGSSWSNAYNNLHQAIKNPCSDTIKIMQGIYKPAAADRDSSFVIDRKMFLLGGYPNTASPSEADRSPDDYPSILSGEIGNPADTMDNSYIILKVNNTDTTVKIDGLTFTRCRSDKMAGSTIIEGGGIYSYNNKNLLLKNCRFTNNTTKYSSAGLYSSRSTLELANCVFNKNYGNYSGSLSGSVLYATSGAIKNSVFEKNQARVTVMADGNFDFSNNVFYRNYAVSGAGVFNLGVSTFVNCNFIENTGTYLLGAGLYNNNNARAYLLNCIFNGNYTGNGYYADWYDYNGSPTGGSQYYVNYKYFEIKKTVLQTSFPYLTPVAAPGNEKFVNISNPIGPDNKWFTADDGLKLLPCSPLVDNGGIFTGVVLESRNLVMPVTDILDSQRIAGATIDVGAYEYPGYYHPVVKITASDSVICAGAAVTFTASPTGGGASPAYQWQVNGVNTGTNSSTFTTSLLNNNDKVSVILTSNDPCITSGAVTSNIITMSVNTSLVPSVSITASNTAICQGTPVQFTATPVNGGPGASFQWQVSGVNTGTNSSTFTSGTLVNNAQVKVILTSSFACATPAAATSNVITMTVTANPVANAGNDVSICAGSSTQLNGSGGTTYVWSPATGLSNAAIANPTAAPSATTAYVLNVSNGSCSATDTVIVTVQPLTAPAVVISTPATTICAGTAAAFTAAATNGGTNPSYQWQVNNINAGTNSSQFSSSTLVNNDQVKVILTSNAACVTAPTAVSNSISINVQQLATPQITVTNKVYTVTNPDAAATYTWQVLANNTWGNVVPAATGITFTAPAGGEYRVMAVKGVCTLYSSSLVSNRRTGLPNNPYGIFVYPNPAQDQITVDSIRLSQNWETLEMMNAEGRAVFPVKNIQNMPQVTIDIRSLSKGTYFIILRRKDGEFTTIKFIKN